MKIALVQNAPVKGNPDKSLAELDRLIGKGCGADIYVLPEMFATGQYIDPTPVVQTMNGQIIQWLQNKAKQLDAAVCGTLPVAENSHVYNRLCFCTPDGSISYYDKHHLFSYSGESQHFTPGSDRVVVKFRGLRILLLICYDLRFPIFSRNHDDYDAVIYPANWPDKRILAWDTLLRARAIENQGHACIDCQGTDVLLSQMPDLIFHQGYKRSNDQTHAVHSQSRYLEGDGLTTTCRHQAQGIFP